MKRWFSIIISIFAFLLLATPAIAEQVIKLDISGLNESARQNVLQRLTVLQTSYGPTLTVAEIHDFYKSAPTNIQKALEPYGYFKPSIAHQSLTHQNNQWTATFVIVPGPVMSISHINISIDGQGQFDPALQRLLADFP